MPRVAIFLIEKVTATGYLRPREGLTNVFLQPQPNQSSSNPTNKTPDGDSLVLSESSNNPGLYYVDVNNPAPRYDLYVSGVKEGDFSGLGGFNLGSSKSVYYKRNVQINSNAYETPQVLTVGSGVLVSPDGGQTWPKFSSSNLPMIVIMEPSELISGVYDYRSVKIVKNTIAVNGSGVLSFNVSLDPNGPTLAAYYCDIQLIMP